MGIAEYGNSSEKDNNEKQVSNKTEIYILLVKTAKTRNRKVKVKWSIISQKKMDMSELALEEISLTVEEREMLDKGYWIASQEKTADAWFKST